MVENKIDSSLVYDHNNDVNKACVNDLFKIDRVFKTRNCKTWSSVENIVEIFKLNGQVKTV